MTTERFAALREYIAGRADNDDVLLNVQLVRELLDAAEEWAVAADLVERQSKILTATINVLRGQPPELTYWSHHDVAERAAQVCSERDLLRAELMHLEQAYSNRHSPQHRAQALNSARAALAGMERPKP